MSTPGKTLHPALRGPLLHLAIAGVSIAAAVPLWLRDDEPAAAATSDVTVWSGRPVDVERVVYESKAKKVVVEAKKDALGYYYVGTIDRETPAPDAGVPPPGTRTVTSFVSITTGTKMADSLAPLKALRALGKIGDDRAAEFGLAEPDATVQIKLGGADKRLFLGSLTPGGGDRYVKDAATGEVYAVHGEPFRHLESAESWMIEREIHEWKEADVVKAKLSAGGKTRTIVRAGPEGKKFWADPAAPNENDDALNNWMSKLDRLRPMEYVAEPPPGRETVLRVEFMGSGKPLGFVELVRTPVGADGKPEYLLQTERTRLFGKTSPLFTEQVEQDIGAVIK